MVTRQTLDISWQSFFRFFIILSSFVAIWYFRHILLSFITAFVFASLFSNLIDWLEKKRFPRFLATIIVYLTIFTVVSLIIYFFLPILLSSFIDFLRFIPPGIDLEWGQKILEGFAGKNNFADFFAFPAITPEQIIKIFGQTLNFLSRFLGGAFSALIIIILSFYINIEKRGIEKTIRLLLPKAYEDYGVNLWLKTQRKVSQWFGSQLILSLFMTAFIYLGLLILQIENALLFAVLAGILDFIPYIGPIIASLPPILVGFSENFILGGLVILVFLIANGIEVIFSPLLRGKALGLNPLLIIAALLLGGKFAGALGVIIAIPLAAVFFEFIRDWHQGKIISYLPQQQLTTDNITS